MHRSQSAVAKPKVRCNCVQPFLHLLRMAGALIITCVSPWSGLIVVIIIIVIIDMIMVHWKLLMQLGCRIGRGGVQLMHMPRGTSFS